MDGRDVGHLIDGGRIDLEGGLAGGLQRGLEKHESAAAGRLLHEQGVARIAALHGKIEGVVGRQRVGGIDAHFALIAAVGHVEREEFDGGAPVLGHVYLFGLDARAR